MPLRMEIVRIFARMADPSSHKVPAMVELEASLQPEGMTGCGLNLCLGWQNQSRLDRVPVGFFYESVEQLGEFTSAAHLWIHEYFEIELAEARVCPAKWTPTRFIDRAYNGMRGGVVGLNGGGMGGLGTDKTSATAQKKRWSECSKYHIFELNKRNSLTS